MAYKNKYQRQKEQSSIDGGATWTDTGETKKGRLLEVASEDCNTVDWREVFGAWFCLKATDLTRWVDSGTTECDGNDKYSIEKEQYSSDGGTTWTDTGQTRQGSLIEYNSPDCTTPSVLYRWVNVSGEYVCVGTDKYTKQKQQYSIDGITWYDVVPANIRQGALIEPNSVDCGSEYIQYRWVVIPDEYVCVGEDKYGKEKEQYSADSGTTWTDTGQTRQGSLIEEGSTDCDYNKYKSQYLTFDILSNGVIKWKYRNNATPKTISYKLNDGEWTVITSTSEGISINVNTGDKVLFKGNNTSYTDTYSTSKFNSFIDSTASYNVYGNIMSLIGGDSFVDITTFETSGTFVGLFINTNVVSAKNLVLPVTTLTSDCYSGMFSGCESLVNAPTTLPATTLAYGCYGEMFQNCTSLVNAPALPATTLANTCYYNMFSGCTNLVNAPALPATTLAQSCYSGMFFDCESLVNAPALPATTLANTCYFNMFTGCTSLTTAPELPALTLVTRCYESMFQNCSNLNYIKAMFTTDPAALLWTGNWVRGVAASGIFVKNANATWTDTGVDSVPSGWTIQYA